MHNLLHQQMVDVPSAIDARAEYARATEALLRQHAEQLLAVRQRWQTTYRDQLQVLMRDAGQITFDHADKSYCDRRKHSQEEIAALFNNAGTELWNVKCQQQKSVLVHDQSRVRALSLNMDANNNMTNISPLELERLFIAALHRGNVNVAPLDLFLSEYAFLHDPQEMNMERKKVQRLKIPVTIFSTLAKDYHRTVDFYFDEQPLQGLGIRTLQSSFRYDDPKFTSMFHHDENIMRRLDERQFQERIQLVGETVEFPGIMVNDQWVALTDPSLNVRLIKPGLLENA